MALPAVTVAVPRQYPLYSHARTSAESGEIEPELKSGIDNPTTTFPKGAQSTASISPHPPTTTMSEIRRKLVIVGDGACGKVRPHPSSLTTTD